MSYSNEVKRIAQNAYSGLGIHKGINLDVAYRGVDGKIYVQYSSDGESWSEPYFANNWTNGIPALCSLNGSFYCMFPATNNDQDLYLAVYNNGFGKGIQTPLKVAKGSSASLATMTVNGVETMFCACKGIDNNLYICSTTDGKNWSNVNTGHWTKTTPALEVLNGKLVCCFVANQHTNDLWTVTSVDGKSWSCHKNNIWRSEFIGTTVMNWYGTETLICAHKGNAGSEKVYIAATTDGANWHSLFPSLDTGLSCASNPGLSSFNGKLVIALQGSDHSLNIYQVSQFGKFLDPVQHKDGFDLQYLHRDFVDFHIDCQLDIHAIFKHSTASGVPEVITLSAASNYTQVTRHLKLNLVEGYGDWTFLMDVDHDIYGILKRRSASDTGKTEVHILGSDSNYQKFKLQKTTPLSYSERGDQFLVATNYDVLRIDRNGNITVLDGDSDFQTIKHSDQVYRLHGDHNFGNAPIQFHLDGDRNIFGVQMNGKDQYETKIYGFNASMSYSVMNVSHVPFPVWTALPAGGVDQHLLLDKNMDLHIIDTNPVGNVYMTHRTLTAASGYQKGSASSNMSIAKLAYPEFNLKQGEVAFFRGAEYSSDALKVSNIEVGKIIQGQDLGNFIDNSVISSVKMGPNTSVTLSPYASSETEDYFVDSNFIDGVSNFRVIGTEAAKEAGIGYSCLLTEDYRYINGKLEPFKAYQTILRLAPGIDAVTVYTEKETTIYSGKDSYQSDNVHGARIQVPKGSDSLVLSVAASKIGTSTLNVRTDDMKPYTAIPIFPDQQVHHKIANLPDGEIHKNKKTLGITHLNKEQCDHVQKAIQNLARGAKSPDSNGPYANKGQMEDAHWQLDLADGKPKYRTLTPQQSQKILNNSKELRAGGAHGLFGDIFHAISHVVSLGVHTMEKAASDVVHEAEHLGSGLINDVEHLAHDVEHVVDTAVQKAEHVANAALKTLGVAHLVHEVEGGIEGLASDAFHGLDDIAQDAVKVVKVTVQFAEHSVSIVAEHTGVVGHLIGTIMKKVGAGIDDVLNFLSALFDWKEIKSIADYMSAGVKQMMNYVKDHSGEINDQLQLDIKSGIGSFDQTVKELKNDLGVTQQQSLSELPELVHRLEWIRNKIDEVEHLAFPQPDLSKLLSGLKSENGAPVEGFEKFQQELERLLGADSEKIFNALTSSIKKILASPKNAPEEVLTLLISEISQIVNDVEEVISLIMNFIFSLFDEFIDQCSKTLEASVEIPFFTQLSELPALSDLDLAHLSHLDLYGIITGTLVTVYDKETHEKLKLNKVTLSYQEDMQTLFSLLNTFFSLYGTKIAAEATASPKPSSSLKAQSLGVAIIYQFLRWPGGYPQKLESLPDNEEMRWAKMLWGYQWLSIGTDVIITSAVETGICTNKRLKPIVTGGLQAVRLVFMIVANYAITNNLSKSKKVSDMLVPVPGILSAASRLTKDEYARVGLATLQVINGSVYCVTYLNASYKN